MKCIQADYVKDFLCDGKACGVRCCRDWKIPVDDDTLSRLKLLDAAEQEEIFSKLDDSAIKLTEEGFCAFLDRRDFLCKIQKAHGEEFLSAICHTYPRVTYKLGGEIFTQSMTLTCPVAAKLILLREEPIQFEESTDFAGRLVISFENRLAKSAEEVVGLQLSAVKILQDRNLTINSRLKKLCEFFGARDFRPFDGEQHAAALVEIFVQTYGAKIDAQNKKTLCKNYLDNRRKNFAAVILENYLANEFFMRCYPYAFLADELTNCKIFVTTFKLLEFALTLTAIAKNNLTVGDLVEFICAVNDKIDHSKGGMDAIKNFAESCEEKNFTALMLEES